MGFCLLVSEIIYYEDVGYLAVFGNLRPVDEETCVCALDISDNLE